MKEQPREFKQSSTFETRRGWEPFKAADSPLQMLIAPMVQMQAITRCRPATHRAPHALWQSHLQTCKRHTRVPCQVCVKPAPSCKHWLSHQTHKWTHGAQTHEWTHSAPSSPKPLHQSVLVHMSWSTHHGQAPAANRWAVTWWLHVRSSSKLDWAQTRRCLLSVSEEGLRLTHPSWIRIHDAGHKPQLWACAFALVIVVVIDAEQL